MADKNVHEGHRKRMREDFKLTGFNNWHEHKVLEFFLHKCLPRVDTNEIAHDLINTFGGFANVFKAPKELLMKVDGVGETTAEYILMLGKFVRYYNRTRFDVNRDVLDSDTCEDYMLDLFDGKEREYCYMICLNARNHVLLNEQLFEGNFESVDLDISKIVRTAVNCDASYVVLAHNHPSGIAKPSNADIVSTQVVEHTLQLCGMKLLDHIIVANGKCVSMRSGYLSAQPPCLKDAAERTKMTENLI